MLILKAGCTNGQITSRDIRRGGSSYRMAFYPTTGKQKSYSVINLRSENLSNFGGELSVAVEIFEMHQKQFCKSHEDNSAQ